MASSLYQVWLKMPPNGNRSGNDTLAAFLVELLRSKIDRDRWIAMTLGNETMRIWRAIRRFGASSDGGITIPCNSLSGSVSNASRMTWISPSNRSCSLCERARAVSWVLRSTACCRRQRSHRKSSMYSVFSKPSKQELRVVELFCGTCRVRLTNAVWLGLYW